MMIQVYGLDLRKHSTSPLKIHSFQLQACLATTCAYLPFQHFQCWMLYIKYVTLLAILCNGNDNFQYLAANIIKWLFNFYRNERVSTTVSGIWGIMRARHQHPKFVLWQRHLSRQDSWKIIYKKPFHLFTFYFSNNSTNSSQVYNFNFQWKMYTLKNKLLYYFVFNVIEGFIIIVRLSTRILCSTTVIGSSRASCISKVETTGRSRRVTLKNYQHCIIMGEDGCRAVVANATKL